MHKMLILIMSFFLVIAFPAFCLGWFHSLPKYDRVSYIAPILWGLIFGTVVCTISGFFFFPNHSWTASYLYSLFLIFLRESLLPFICVYTVFNIFSKDSFSYRINSFLPLMAAFYTVFIPYRVYTGGDTLSFFVLFIKPILFICSVTIIEKALKIFYKGKTEKSKKHIVLSVIMTFVAMFMPAILEAWWRMNGKLIILLPFAIIYSMVAFVIYLKLKKESEREPIFFSVRND